MKTRILSLLVISMFVTLNVFAEKKTEKFKVDGNCGMCEKRIEKAAKAVDGVIKADWDSETKEMVVDFDPTITSLDKVQAAIAKVGHDTPLHKADAKTYDALPGCCHYDRAEADMKMDDKKAGKMDMKMDDKMKMTPVK